MRLVKKGYFVVLLILILCFLFFSRLFYPKPSLFYTPDFGQSDIWNFNYPIKNFLAQSLKSGQLPFWSKDVGTGFPFLAEGQIGTFNIFNLILFYIFPAWLAWNLSYLIIFFAAFLGTYLFLRKNKLSNFASFFAGFIFSFSGFFVCHISHFNLIQTASFLPWLFLTIQSLLEKPKKTNFLFFALVLSQQIFSGHPQITFISLVGVSFFFMAWLTSDRRLKSAITKNQENKTAILKKLSLFVAALTFGLALAAPQILPSFKLAQLSNRSRGLSSKTIFQYPYPFKHIITFLIPNFFGTPKDGSYPPFGPGWGIYWENTAYLGILPLLLVLLLVIYRGYQSIQPRGLDSLATLVKKHRNLEKSFWILLIISFLLILGKDSPLYFLFTFPGFNFFRVPSRFLVLTAFSIAVLSAFGFDYLISFLSKKIKSKKILLIAVYCLLFTTIFDLFHFGFSYHPLVPVKEALKPPETANVIEADARIFTNPRQMKAWNEIFLNEGWKDINPYLYFKNGLAADLNLLFDKTNIEAFYALPPARQQYYQESLNRKLINAAGVKYIISPEKIEERENLELIKTISTPETNLPNYSIYESQEMFDRFRFASNYKIAKTVKGFLRTINQKEFAFENTVILEQDLGEELEELKVAEIKLIKDENQKLILETNTGKKAILVIADSFYPEWKAKIDGQETKILPANLNQRAIIVPEGKHEIEMYYYPESFYRGVIITISSLIAFFILAKLFFNSSTSEECPIQSDPPPRCL